MTIQDIDVQVTVGTPSAGSDPDPLARLFVDRTTPGGRRVVAIAEPIQRTTQGYLTAAHALAAFEETAVVAIDDDIEPGLMRAFTAANDVVRRANRALPPRQRVYAGITAAVIKDGTAIIGLVPPGQALLLQDGRIYGVPDLTTWQPGFMPTCFTDAADPLGWTSQPQPVLRRTSVGRWDQLLVGASAVGRVLSTQPLTAIADLSAAAVLDRLDAGLAAAGIDDAFAALVTFDAAPASAPALTDSDDSRLAEIERLWRGGAPTPTRAGATLYPASEAEWRGCRRDEIHRRMIEWSERVLGRDDTEPLPLDRGARAAAPLGAGSLDRYTPSHFGAFSAAARTVMPRGFHLPVARRTLTVLLVLAITAAALSTGYGVQRAQADRGDRYLATFNSEIELVRSAASTEVAERHLGRAEQSLDAAEDRGEDVTTERALLLSLRDAHLGIRRLSGLTRIGQLPATINGENARLLVAGGRLHLVAGSVFHVDPATQQLQAILRPGMEIDGLTAGTIVDATVDAGTLVATDGRSLFIADDRGRWSAARLADADLPGGWRGTACGAYKGSFYLLDAAGGQIQRFGAGRYDEQPDPWLVHDARPLVEAAVDMVIDGSIHVLLADGTIQTLFKGEPREEPHRVTGGEGATPVALYGGTSVSYLYVIERVDGESRLIRYDPGSRSASSYLAPVEGHAEHDPQAARAFSAARDFAVDEGARTVYFLTADSLWQASIG